MGATGLKSSPTGSGNSPFDVAAIGQALGQNIQMLHNRYTQLGLGQPLDQSGNVASQSEMVGPQGIGALAANSGQSLQYGAPGTAEQTDVSGLQNMAQAALGLRRSQSPAHFG